MIAHLFEFGISLFLRRLNLFHIGIGRLGKVILCKADIRGLVREKYFLCAGRNRLLQRFGVKLRSFSSDGNIVLGFECLNIFGKRALKIERTHIHCIHEFNVACIFGRFLIVNSEA